VNVPRPNGSPKPQAPKPSSTLKPQAPASAPVPEQETKWPHGFKWPQKSSQSATPTARPTRPIPQQSTAARITPTPAKPASVPTPIVEAPRPDNNGATPSQTPDDEQIESPDMSWALQDKDSPSASSDDGVDSDWDGGVDSDWDDGVDNDGSDDGAGVDWSNTDFYKKWEEEDRAAGWNTDGTAVDYKDTDFYRKWEEEDRAAGW
jgi:hypothetical protein